LRREKQGFFSYFTENLQDIHSFFNRKSQDNVKRSIVCMIGKPEMKSKGFVTDKENAGDSLKKSYCFHE